MHHPPRPFYQDGGSHTRKMRAGAWNLGATCVSPFTAMHPSELGITTCYPTSVLNMFDRQRWPVVDRSHTASVCICDLAGSTGWSYVQIREWVGSWDCHEQPTGLSIQNPSRPIITAAKSIVTSAEDTGEYHIGGRQRGDEKVEAVWIGWGKVFWSMWPNGGGLMAL